MEQQLSMPQIYSLVNHKLSTAGIEGYHVENKHYDCAKMMKDREAGPIKKG